MKPETVRIMVIRIGATVKAWSVSVTAFSFTMNAAGKTVSVQIIIGIIEIVVSRGIKILRVL